MAERKNTTTYTYVTQLGRNKDILTVITVAHDIQPA